MLASRLRMDDEERVRLRRAGPAESGADAETAGRFGLAVFLGLAQAAQRASQPLLLDY
jgi:hypothetical protein